MTDMIAGRELDARIATDVMELCAHDLHAYTRDNRSTRYEDYITYRCRRCGETFAGLAYSEGAVLCERYSTDIAAAWLVAQKVCGLVQGSLMRKIELHTFAAEPDGRTTCMFIDFDIDNGETGAFLIFRSHVFVLQYIMARGNIIVRGRDTEAVEMTLQQIMTRAHQIARTCTGDYSARITLGLRQAWTEAHLQTLGSEWTKGAMHRIYFNNLTKWFGLECDTYKTGNIAYATLGGDRISNSQARKIDGRLCMAKIYYDLSDGRFHGQSLDSADFEAIVKNIKTAAKAA